MAFLLGMPFFGYNQQLEIQGTIVDSLNNPISNCIITASVSKNENNILAYKSSDANGNYKLILKNDTKIDSILLIIRHIAYKSVQIKLPFKSINKDFKLFAKIKLLDEVVIKNQKKVEIRGDTLTYNVKGIKAEKDYTIEEVINRIPGVTISENGQIKYLDKPISHLYINGLDLLEGGYAIATQGIPADAVKEIDVMKKHHHERIDIGRSETDNVAFNLKIKEDVGLFFGSVKGDIGVPFITGKVDATPIYMKDKFQNISSIKLNNIGKTLRNIGTDLTSGNINIGDLLLEDTNVINSPNINGIVVSDKYWLNNESYAITNDALHKVNDSTLVKWNFNYVNELSKIENKSSTVFLTNNESSTVLNSSKNQLATQRFNVGVNQEINKRNFYLKNNTNFRLENDNGIEDVSLNNIDIVSNYKHNDFLISNNTFLKTIIGKNNIIQGGIIAQYEHKNEELRVAPPVFETLFGNNTDNDETLQNVAVKKFNVAGFTDYGFKLLNLQWNINQNLKYNNFKFDSNLQQIPNYTNQSFPFSSNFDYQKVAATTKIISKINIGSTKFSWGLSADYIYLNSTEKNDSDLVINDSFLFFQPYLAVKHDLNKKWVVGASYVQNNNISNFDELYTSIILKSYNTVTQNPLFVNHTKTESFAPYLNYNNILNSFFFNINGNWTQTKSDVTFSNELSEEGFITSEVINQPNTIKNYRFSTNIKKSFLGSFSADLTYSYNYIANVLFFNDEFLDAVNRRQSIDLGISWDKGSWFTMEYKAKLNFGTSSLPTSKISNSFFFQTATIDFYTSKSTRINLGLEYSQTKTTQSYTIDKNSLFNTSFFYKPSKKVYLNFSLLNIFNTPFFTTTNNFSNFQNVYQFSLRERQFTVGFTYSL